jgi:hypothetical protein
MSMVKSTLIPSNLKVCLHGRNRSVDPTVDGTVRGPGNLTESKIAMQNRTVKSDEQMKLRRFSIFN